MSNTSYGYEEILYISFPDEIINTRVSHIKNANDIYDSYIYNLIAWGIFWLCVKICYYINDMYKQQTLQNEYWNSMDKFIKYEYELDSLILYRDILKNEIIKLKGYVRKGTLRNNKKEDFATDEDVQIAEEELKRTKIKFKELFNYKNLYYQRTLKITHELNDLEL
tara:strand:+ start:315 stop:812 length:498 start_codon:yes stop_codon:yes gene_type:complete